MLTPEVAWAAGLFEGEGCIDDSGRNSIRITLSMCDEDSVWRFARAVGRPEVHFKFAPGMKRREQKPQYLVRASGHDAVDILTILWEGLGQRRRARALELLSKAHIRRPRRYKEV